MYSHIADRLVVEGHTQKTIKRLQTLLGNNPHYLGGWLHLTTLFVETGQIHQALSTLNELRALYPQYEKARQTFQQLRTKVPAISTGPIESAYSL